MQTGIKLLLAAVLSLSVGVAFASPLYLLDMNIIPFPRAPEGPKADFSVDIVYANFNVQEQPIDSTLENDHSIVDYQIVLNITNNAEIAAKLGKVQFAAAQNITMLMGAAKGGTSSSSGGIGTGTGTFGATIEGLWLDNEWLNLTWIPGVHPDGYSEAMRSGGGYFFRDTLATTIPILPENASDAGYWIEGVAVRHHYIFNHDTNELTLIDAIYVNGTWVDVTGRIRIENPVPSVMEFGTFVQTNTVFIPRDAYVNTTPDQLPKNASATGIHTVYIVLSGNRDFDSNWNPGQSRLIQITGTANLSNSLLRPLMEQKINLYADAINYVYYMPIDGVFYDTSSTSTQLKAIIIEKTADGYLYNAVLGNDQVFESDQFGVEVFIKPRS